MGNKERKHGRDTLEERAVSDASAEGGLALAPEDIPPTEETSVNYRELVKTGSVTGKYKLR